MSGLIFDRETVRTVIEWTAVVLVLAMFSAVVVERTLAALREARRQRVERHYAPLLRRAVGGDEDARRRLEAAPPQHRLILAMSRVLPLIRDPNPEKIAEARSAIATLGLTSVANRYLHSRWWWKRAVMLRAVGLLQIHGRTGLAIEALDDPHPDVRAAGLDALADLQDPRSLPAIIVRLHDTSLHRGRRAAALAAFGFRCEPFLLDLSEVDPVHRVNYARALLICGTDRSRPVLCRWTSDERADVQAAAFEALSRIGLDEASARRAIEALETADDSVRAMAAHALHGWNGDGEAARKLAAHLDDTWAVAVRAARSLRSMGDAGARELEAQSSRTDLAGLLARQMLWRKGASP